MPGRWHHSLTRGRALSLSVAHRHAQIYEFH